MAPARPADRLGRMTKPARPEPPMIAGEREQLTGFLDHQRATIVWKSSGLTGRAFRWPG